MLVKTMKREWRVRYLLNIEVLAMQWIQVHKVLTNFGRPRSKLVEVFVEHS